MKKELKRDGHASGERGGGTTGIELESKKTNCTTRVDETGVGGQQGRTPNGEQRSGLSHLTNS